MMLARHHTANAKNHARKPCVVFICRHWNVSDLNAGHGMINTGVAGDGFRATAFSGGA